MEVVGTGEEEGSDEGMEVMWGRLRRKGLGDILIDAVYVTPQGLSNDFHLVLIPHRKTNPTPAHVTLS